MEDYRGNTYHQMTSNKSVPKLNNNRGNRENKEIDISNRRRRNTENNHNHTITNQSPGDIEPTIGFEDFMNLLAIPGTSHGNWDNNPDKELTVLETEYHLIRQILMIMNRKLDDISAIINSMNMYSPNHIFEFLLTQNNLKNTQDMTVENVKMDYDQEIINSDQFDVTSVKYTDPLSPKTHCLTRDTYEFKHSQQITSMEFLNSKSIDFTNKKFLMGKPNISDEMTQKEKSKLGSNVVLENSAIVNFLERNEIHFISEDIDYILRAFGTKNQNLGLQHIQAFFSSPVWSI